MGKRVSIFELVEGVTYNAYKGAHKFSKQYTMKNGVLHNSEGDIANGSEGDMLGCNWVPMNADVEFEPAKDLPQGAQAASVLGAPVSVLFLREGIAYKATNKDGSPAFRQPVTRDGKRLSFVDDSMKIANKVDVRELDLGITYTPIAMLAVQPAAQLTTEQIIQQTVRQTVAALGAKRQTAKRKVKTKHLVAKKKAAKRSTSRKSA